MSENFQIGEKIETMEKMQPIYPVMMDAAEQPAPSAESATRRPHPMVHLKKVQGKITQATCSHERADHQYSGNTTPLCVQTCFILSPALLTSLQTHGFFENINPARMQGCPMQQGFPVDDKEQSILFSYQLWRISS